jgi:peptidylprolyl isomerase
VDAPDRVAAISQFRVPEGPPVHTRRTSVRLLLPAVLLTAAAALAGCGSSDSSGSSGGDTLGVEAVHVSGDVGDSATVSFDGKVSDTTPQTKTLTTGTGPELQTGDTFAAQIVVADGFTQKTAQSSYDQHAPQVVTLSSTLPSWLLDALKGQTIGSRILVYTAADKIYGSTGNAQLGISNKDMLAVVLRPARATPSPRGRPRSRRPRVSCPG